jgi:RNA polymerase sigma-70 factor (ECF subfamily)
VFLLREVFEYGYAEIAAIVGKSEANCRQMARRARQHVAERHPRFESSPEEQERLTHQFIQSCISGDMPGLISLLAEDITLWSDGGGQVAAALKPIKGADKGRQLLLPRFDRAGPARGMGGTERSDDRTRSGGRQ